jgi:hypothetical protein
MLQIDRATVELTPDSAFRDTGSTRPEIAFDRPDWPQIGTGTAVPHDAVFDPQSECPERMRYYVARCY